MLPRFFKSKSRLSDPDPEVRRRAVEELSEPKAENLADQLITLARTDEDPGVRAACIARLADPAALAGLLDDTSTAAPAAARIAALLPPDDVSDLGRHPLVLKTRLPSLDPGVAESLLAAVQDQGQLIELALAAEGGVRARLLDRLNTADALTELEHRTRDRNKKLNRHARERLEALKTARQGVKNARARVLELAEALERHQRAQRDDAHGAKQNALLKDFDDAVQRYQARAEELAGFGEAPQDIADPCRIVADIRQSLEAAAAAPEPAAAAAPERAAPAVDPFIALVTEFRELNQRLVAGDDFDAVRAQRQALTDRWLEAADHRQPTPEEHEVFETVSHAFNELAGAVDRLEATGALGLDLEPLPDSLPDDPADAQALWRTVARKRRAMRQAQKACERVAWPEWARPDHRYGELLIAINRLEQDLERVAGHEAALVTRLEAALTALTAEIDSGALQAALGTLNQARRAARALPDQAARALTKTLNREAARLAELRDWQTFVTTPKRESLCDAMRELADQPLEAKSQAERIKQLRREWNDLGPVSKADDRKLAATFNELAERAFEPCRTFFAAQAERRKANLAERRRICEQLETYLDNTNWDSADMKAAEQILRTARAEWRRFHPVDRNPGKPVEERFERLQGRLHELVKAEWDRNLERKRAIVAEARALAEQSSDVRARVEEAKNLQRRWREVGITPRRPDQRLWREFREACDAIFNARESARQQSEAALSEAMAEANKLLDEFRAVLDDATPDTASDTTLRELRSRFANLPALPERTGRGIERQFDELARAYRDLLHRQARAAERARLEELQRLDAAFSRESAAGPPDPAFGTGDGAELDTLHELTVRAELLANSESPPEDKDLRLKVQVALLNTSLGQQQAVEDPMTLARQWCSLGPKPADAETLRQRFFTALLHMLDD